MNLLRCLALLNSVSFVAAQCSLVFPWLTSNECGVDPLDNTYPEYPVSYIGACGPAYTAVNQEILGFATYTATNAIKSEVAAEPSGDPDVAYTYTVSDVANNAIQLGSVVTVSFTDRQELSVTGSFTYAAVPKPSIFFTTPTSTVQASIVVTTTLTSTSTVEQTTTSTLPQATTTSQCTVQTSTVTAKTSTSIITHTITPKPVTVISTQYSWSTTRPACLPCKKAGVKRDLAPRAHNRRLDKRQESSYTYEVPNCGAVTPVNLPTGTVVLSTTTSTLTVPTTVFTSPTTTITASPTPPTTTVCSTAVTTQTTTPTTTITDSTMLNPSIVHTTTVVTYTQTVWTKGVRPCR